MSLSKISYCVFEIEFKKPLNIEDFEVFSNRMTSLPKRIKGFKYFKNKNILESKKNKFPNIKEINIDDFLVFIGKDAKSNDHLTFNVATEDDIWFHSKGVPGSHVVIRVKGLAWLLHTDKLQ